ncbi:MAG: hypothetical protein AAGM22_01030 [Acidobacteriota bacterium]
MQKHDALWKELIRAFFPEFIELVLPQVAAVLDCTKPRFLEQESFVDYPDGSFVRMDVVAEVPFRDQLQQLVIILTEIEREFGAAMDRRVFRYFAHLKIKLDKPVIPIVLFLRGGPAGVEKRDYREAIGDFVVHKFTYCAVGLSRAKLEDFIKKSSLGPALASCTRGDGLPPFEQKFRCVEAILDAGVDDARQILLLNTVETYLELDETEELKYQRRVEASPKREEVREMETTWADRLRHEGLEAGRREGVAAGRREGVAAGRREGVAVGRREGVALGRREGVAVAHRLLMELAVSRFGDLTPSVKARFEALGDLAEIAAWSERILKADSLAELGLDSES